MLDRTPTTTQRLIIPALGGLCARLHDGVETLLRVVAGLSVPEASRVMGKSEGAIRVLQHRAVGALRRRVAHGP